MIKQTTDGYLVYCPACKTDHLFDHRWDFNGDLELPTFTPSLVVQIDFSIKNRPDKKCHSFLIDGEWHYLNDCTHEMAGQTVKIKP